MENASKGRVGNEKIEEEPDYPDYIESRDRLDQLLTDGRLKEAIVLFVKGYPHTTFAEIGRHFEYRHSIKGDVIFGLENFKNVILWGGVTEEFRLAIEELINEKKIYIYPCELFIYLADGGVLNYPVVHELKDYPDSVWLPVSLSIYPPDSEHTKYWLRTKQR